MGVASSSSSSGASSSGTSAIGQSSVSSESVNPSPSSSKVLSHISGVGVRAASGLRADSSSSSSGVSSSSTSGVGVGVGGSTWPGVAGQSIASWLSINPSPSSSTRLSQISGMVEVDPSVLSPDVLSPSSPFSKSVAVPFWGRKETKVLIINKNAKSVPNRGL